MDVAPLETSRGRSPHAFPKGFAEYEISHGDYVDFVIHIGPEEATFRAIHATKGYERNRGSISLARDWYQTRFPNRPANYISWDDGCAFADWAGLRPMTELEFTKACRGPDRPEGADFPSGTDDASTLGRDIPPGEFDFALSASDPMLANSTNRRILLGLSYYGVVDLAGSVWERCVTIGHPAGRAFRGSHGDGRLHYGYATNNDWPRGDAFGGGYGYRGGGHYEGDRRSEPGHFNPHSRVAWRRFGSWGEAPRSKAYGLRCVRTAP